MKSRRSLTTLTTMPRSSGGAQNLRRGDRVQVKLNSCYRYYLNGLIGEVTCVLDYGAVVALDSDPAVQQKVIEPAGRAGPKNPTRPQRIFQFNELVKLAP